MKCRNILELNLKVECYQTNDKKMQFHKKNCFYAVNFYSSIKNVLTKLSIEACHVFSLIVKLFVMVFLKKKAHKSILSFIFNYVIYTQ